MTELPPEFLRALVALEADPAEFAELFADEVDGSGDLHGCQRSDYVNRLAWLIDGLLRLAAMPRDGGVH